MPEIVRQVAEAYGADPEELRPATPSARATSEMDEVLNRVSLIPQDKFVLRRVIRCRALVSPCAGSRSAPPSWLSGNISTSRQFPAIGEIEYRRVYAHSLTR